MRSIAWCGALWLAVLGGLGAEETSAAQEETEKWAAEDALDAQRFGQTDMAITAIGRFKLAQREWTDEELQNISAIDAGVFHTTMILRKQVWVGSSATMLVRFADAGLMTWLRQNPGVETVQAQGRLRVDGKYFVVASCRPANEKSMPAPPVGRSKRGGM